MGVTEIMNDPPPSGAMRSIAGFVGIAAAIENLLILLVFILTKKLLRSSYLLVALTFAHFLNGLTHIWIGLWPQSYENVMVHYMYCFKLVFPAAFLATYQFLPIILSLNALERFLAMSAPMWYRTKCTQRRQLYLAVGSGIVFLLLVAGNQVKGFLETGDRLTPASCVPPLIYGFQYMLYWCHGLSVVGGVIAVVITGAAVYNGRRRVAKLPTISRSEIKRMRRQLRLTSSLLMISCLDVVCMVVPNIFLILYVQGALHIPLAYTVYPTVVYGSDSLWNIIPLLLFNNEFKRAASNLIHCNRKVQPIISVTGGTNGITRRIPSSRTDRT